MLDRSRAASWTLSASALAVAAGSAFELRSRVALGGLEVSSLEAVVFVALVCGAAAIVGTGARPRWHSPITWPGLACLAVLATTALLAPSFQGNALRFSGRVVAAALVFVLAMNAVASRQVARALVAVLLAVGACVGVVAVLEVTQVPWVLTGLKAFRTGFHVVGGQLRATSTFVYPTVASMYLEVVFALGLWWLVEPPAASRSFAVRLAPGTALVLVGAGIIATFTRAGIIAMAVSLCGVAAMRLARRPLVDGAQRALGGLALVLAALVLLSRSPEALVSRVSTDTAQDWYGATYAVPERLTFRTGGLYDVPVTVTNEGLLTWQSHREPVFAMSYHWLAEDTDLVVEFEGARTPFDEPVQPGDRVTVPVAVRAPRNPGAYVLVWDVVHEGRAWLSTEGVPSARSRVRVEGAVAASPPVTRGRLPGASIRPPRLALWNAALQIAADRPLTGVGPDNFRHVYGPYLGLAAWDHRLHANNTYLEALAGTGVFGAIALVWLVIAGAVALWTRWRRAPDALAAPLASALVAWIAVAGHGLVDSFMSFTPTYVVFALMAGFAFSRALDDLPEAHAHRL